jgi:hypothetical protein
MGAAMYAVENPNAKKLLSPDFFSCVLENIGAQQYGPDAVSFTSYPLHGRKSS